MVGHLALTPARKEITASMPAPVATIASPLVATPTMLAEGGIAKMRRLAHGMPSGAHGCQHHRDHRRGRREREEDRCTTVLMLPCKLCPQAFVLALFPAHSALNVRARSHADSGILVAATVKTEGPKTGKVEAVGTGWTTEQV